MDDSALASIPYGDLRFVRDTLKEAKECDDIIDVLHELQEAYDVVEAALRSN